MNTPVQLSLGLSLHEDATFENYFTTESNTLVVAALKHLSAADHEARLAVWGARGAGVSHLLQACCHQAVCHQQSVQYLPLPSLVGYAAEDVCEGLETLDLVCIDGLESICGHRDWELALFHLFNRMKDEQKRLLLGAHTSFPSLPILLADLKSRILGCEIYQVASLNDQEKAQAMIRRADQRGMEMPEDVAKFLLNRGPRSPHAVFDMLDYLDEVSLQRQRKLTIPFVKEVFGY